MNQMMGNEVGLEDLHAIYYRLFDRFQRFLKDHDIDYCAIAGTVLGTVRESGFIPWDDDMDIGLLPDQYLKLLDVLSKTKEEWFEVNHYSTNKKANVPLLRIDFQGTWAQDLESKNNSHKWHIDVFPLTYVPSSPELIEKQKEKMRRIKKASYYKERPWLATWKTFLFVPLAKLVLLPFSRRYLMKKYNDVAFCDFHGQIDHGRVCSMMSQYSYEKQTFPVSFYTETIEHEFGPIKIMIPRNYDTYLRQLYGPSYMTPKKRDEPKKKYFATDDLLALVR